MSFFKFVIVTCLVDIITAGPPLAYSQSKDDPTKYRAEICMWERFEPDCPAQKVAHIHSAAYGRMYLGRCVQQDYGSIGCQIDVTDRLTSTCSQNGQQMLDIFVPNPCPPELVTFLDVSYSCRFISGFGDDTTPAAPTTQIINHGLQRKEVCLWETFHADCPPDHRLHINTARYGRMYTGRCVHNDDASIGCQANVTDHVTSMCEGQTNCSASILGFAGRTLDCPHDLIGFLEVSYSCRYIGDPADIAAGDQPSSAVEVAGNIEVGEYCEWETFQPVCQAGESVTIQFARYGRMSIGRCIEKGFGYMGCENDVTLHLKGLCDGRSTCSQEVLSDVLAGGSCPPDLMEYLEVVYSCGV